MILERRSLPLQIQQFSGQKRREQGIKVQAEVFHLRLQMNAFPQNPHSDQSISEEEELVDDWPENCVSLGGTSEEKEGLQIQSQIEILRGTHKLNHVRKTVNSSNEAGVVKNEVKMPIFHNEGDFICFPKKSFTYNSDEEVISDDEESNVLKVDPPSCGIEKQYGSYSWSAETKKAGAQVYLNENSECSSSRAANFKANTSCKGGRGKGKPKFLFRFKSQKEEHSWFSLLKDKKELSSKVRCVPERLEAIVLRNAEHSMTELLGGFQTERNTDSEINGVPAEVQAFGHGFAKHSMAELLDGLQDKPGLLNSSSKKYHRTKGRRVELGIKKSTSSLGDRNIDNEDPPEPMGSGTSSDDETNDQNLKLVIPGGRSQTMTDRFHEVLGASCAYDEGFLLAAPRLLCGGLFGKLQQVMQSEKDREMDFSRKLQAGASPNDEAGCIDVKILSKSLDAKLTVCQCAFREHKESPRMTREMGGRKRTIIFNPRACSDVDLEVGNLIRIHPPWRGKDYSGSPIVFKNRQLFLEPKHFNFNWMKVRAV